MPEPLQKRPVMFRIDPPDRVQAIEQHPTAQAPTCRWRQASMPIHAVLLVKDAALRAAITFALEIEGFAVTAHADASDLISEPATAADCIVIDAEPGGSNPLDCLDRLRQFAVCAPAIILVSYPGRRMRSMIAQAGAVLVEKPLLSDVLAATIRYLAG